MKIDHQLFPITTSSWRELNAQWNRQWHVAQTEDGKMKIDAKVLGHVIVKGVIAVAALVNLLATPLLLSLDIIGHGIRRLRGNTNPAFEGGCYRFLYSNVFESYRDQMRTCISDALNNLSDLRNAIEGCADGLANLSQLEREIISFIRSLQYGRGQDLSSKEWHRYMLRQFRRLHKEISATDENSPVVCQGRVFLRKLIEFRYQNTDLIASIHSYLTGERFIHHNHIPSNFLSELEENYRALRSDRRLNNNGPMTELYDSAYFGNLPFKIRPVTLRSGKSCQLIRMSSITQDLERDLIGGTTKASLTEEAECLSTVLREQGKAHLYINLMSRTRGNEAIRAQIIEGFDQREDSSISVLSLDKNSSFYMQSKQYKQEWMDGEKFKKELVEHMLHSKYSYWPCAVRGKVNIRDIADQVHKEYFCDKKSLNRQERLDCIELVYLKVIDQVMNILEPSSCNITCKDGIDRAVTQIVTLYVYTKLQQGQSLSSEDKAYFKALLFGPAILVANRPPQQYRVERMLSALKRIQRN